MLAVFALMPVAFAAFDLLPQMVLDMIAALTLIGAAYTLKRMQPRLRAAPAIAAVIVLIVAAANLFQVWLTQGIYQTTNIMLIMVAAGVIILSPAMLMLVWALIWAGWLFIILGLPQPQPLTVHFGFAMAIANIIGGLIYLVRINSIRRNRVAELQTRRFAEEQLADKERFNSILDGIDDLLWSVALPSRQLLYMNPAAQLAMGRSLAEFQSNPQLWAEVFRPEDHEILDKQYKMAETSGNADSAELRLVRPDGSERWVLTRWRVVRVNGQPVRLDMIADDITDLRQLEIGHRRMAAAIQAAGDSIVITDVSGAILEANPAFERLTGYKCEELKAQNPRVLKSGLQDDAFYRQMWDVLVSGGTWRGRFFNRRKDGSLYHAEAVIAPIMNAGVIVGYVGAQNDITEAVRIEEDLRRSEARFRMISENSDDVIWVLDLALGRFTYFSPSVTRKHGWTPEEALNLPLAGHLPSERNQQLTLGLGKGLQALANGDESMRNFTIEVETTCKDGSFIPMEIAISLLTDASGKPVQVLGVGRDISERRRAAAELTASNAALAVARDDALQASRLKSEFLATMSHELRTPLNAIIGLTGLLIDTDMSELQRDYAETVRRSSENLLVLINDILDFSKIEAGKLEMEDQPFSLRDCVESAVDLTLPIATQKGITLTYEIAPGIPAILMGDVTRLRQIMVNLLGNAVKFTTRGRVALAVKGTTTADERLELAVAVTDTGIGMTPEQQERLFKAFSQGDASTSRRYGGTGLGLVITQRLAAMMGGRIWVESEIKRGSTFYVTAQLKIAAIQPDRQPGEANIAAKHMLIVAASSSRREMLLRWIESWSAHASVVGTAAEALSILRAAVPLNVVLIDVKILIDADVPLVEALRARQSALPVLLLASDPQDIPAAEEWRQQWPAARVLPGAPKASKLLDALAEIFIQVPRTATVQQAIAGVEANQGVTHPLSILLADDSPVNQKVGLRMLERIGYRADVVSNGLEALEALQRQRYDVVLMDVQMPEMDGIEAAAAIRYRYPPESRPRIVAMTAHALVGDRERFLATGMDGYLAKPVRLAELANELRTCAMIRHGSGETSLAGALAAIAPPALIEPGPALDPGDLASLQEVLGGTARQVMAEIGPVLLDYAAPLLIGMREALQRQDGGELSHAAHALKSSSSYTAAPRLAALCGELEVMGHAGQFGAATAKLAAVETEFGRVKTAIQSIMA